MKKFFYILTIIIGSIVTSCKSSDQKFVEDMYSDPSVFDHKFEENNGFLQVIGKSILMEIQLNYN